MNRFLDDPLKFIIDGLLNLVGIPPASFWALVNRVQQVISDIAEDPLGFAENLLAAIGQGFAQFFDRFGQHIVAGFWDWLFSGLGSVGVQIPTDFSLKSIITFILQLMGTSIVGAIAAEELTAIANNLVMETFRSFEVYIVIAVIYFVLVQAASLIFAGIGRLLFRWKS